MFEFLGLVGLLLSTTLISFACAFYARRNVLVPLSLISVAVLVNWEFPNDILIGKVFGSSIYYQDLVSLFLFLTVMINYSRAGRFGGVIFWWSLTALAFGISIIVGLSTRSYSAVFVESRSVISAMAVFTWGLSIDWSLQHRKTLRIWSSVLAWSLIGLAAYHALRTGLGSADELVGIGVDGIVQTSRILTSQQALVLLLATTVNFHISKSRMRQTLLVASAIILVLSQQRTVWVSCLFVVGLGLIYSRDRLKHLLTFVYWVGLGIALLLVSGSPTIRAILLSLSSSNTFGARTDSWVQILQPAIDKGLLSIMFGSPFGSGFLRFLNDGTYATYNPHNFYVFLFVRTGLAGLVAYLVSLWLSIKQAFRSRKPWTVIILAVASVYGFTYNVDFSLCLFISVAVVVSAKSESRIHFG